MSGFTKYLRFIINRERLNSSLWIVLIVVSTYLIALLFPSLLGDDASKFAMVEMLKSPAMVGMLGPLYGTEAYSVSISFSQMMSTWLMITIAVMNIFFVNRHTRVDEEQGRLEMLRSFSLGRLTNSMSTISGALILNLIIAILTTISIVIVNLEGYTLSGALAYSFQISTFGLLMAAITLFFAQLFSTSRSSGTAAFATLGVFYLMRAAGDYNDGIISYISPMGLGLRVFPFYKDNVYPIVIQLIETIIIVIISFKICSSRDLGEGVVPAKKGRAHAKKSLLSPFGLALRLTKNPSIIWCLVNFIIGAMYGSMIGDIDSFIESNDFYKQMLNIDNNFANTLTDSFLAMLFVVMAHLTALPVIGIANKLRSEENKGRLEQIFARSVKRNHLMGSFVIIAFAEGVFAMFFSVLGLYVASIGTNAIVFGNLLKSGMCYLPAIWLFASISILLTGILPRQGVIIWIVYAYSFFMVFFGKVLDFPEILQKLSPFGNVPQLPIQDFNMLPLIIMTLFAVLLIVIGIWKFNERDID